MIRRLCVSLAGLLLAGVPAYAQAPGEEVRIRLESESGVPVAGALVALVDSGGRMVAEGLSTATGLRTLRAPSGIYSVRVRRIGYRPYVSDPVVLPRAGELLLRVESAPVVLGTVVVAARSQCRRIDSDADALATVWDEVVKALRATELTTGDLAGIGQVRVYRKRVLNDGTVTSADTSLLRPGAKRPFRAHSPAVLATVGYVVGSEEAGWEFFGADETILLSDEFRATHCFRLVREQRRRGQIGLAFDPVPRRPVADVAGVLWVDEGTSELRELVYRYTNAGLVSRFGGSGYTRFRRMRSGAWIVDEWWIRMPVLVRRVGPGGDVATVGHVERGGDIVTPGEDVLNER